MNKFFSVIAVFVLLSIFSSCSDFLDQIPDEKLSEDNLFQSKDDAVKVLTQVYAYYKSPIDFVNSIGLSGDNVKFNWSNYDSHRKDIGTFGPGDPVFNNWNGIYNSIRTSIYFLSRIDECKDEKLTDQERAWWKGEAEFLQAYYYFLLLQQYGPVPLITKIYEGNELTDAIESGVPRASFDEMVSYIDNLLVSASEKLDVTYAIPDRAGRANASAALSLRSRLWLYAASPLYNGLVSPTGQSYFQLMIKDKDGRDLLSSDFDAGKWQKALDAAREAIALAKSGGYGLYLGDGNKYSDGLSLYRHIFSYPRGGEPSIETIFYKQNFSTGNWVRHSMPVSWSSYSGICPTLEHVGEYFMANGLMPEDDTEYQSVDGFETYQKDGFEIELYKKFKKRDPRFYSNILFPERYSYAMLDGDTESYDTKWCGESDNDRVYFRPYADGPDGFNSKTGRDYCITGFLCLKWVAPSVTKTNFGDYAVPVFRYAELLLNLMESAFEYSVAKGENPLFNNEIFDAWDELRERIGMPGVRDAYAAAGIPLSEEKLRQLIHRERRVELAFEAHRYFDNRRWLDAKREGGEMHGYDIMENGEEFWVRKPFETRFWNDKLYFMPIPQVEIDKNPALTQNPLW